MADKLAALPHPALTDDERKAVAPLLTAEYGLLGAALGAVWSASLVRTSLYLGVLSAAGVALGFVAQGGIGSPAFRTVSLVVLPLVLFLGVATFVRLVQVQREATVYVTGINRIRHFMIESAPPIRSYLVLPPYDDEVALYRSIGTGMNRRPPRSALLNQLSQTQGIVGVVTGVVAAAFVGLAVAPAGEVLAWVVGGLGFVASVAALFAYWRRSMADLARSIRPLHPTPPEELDAPI